MPSPDEPDIVAVVPTLGRTEERLRRCLASIESVRDEGLTTIVVVWNDPRRASPHLGDVVILTPGCNLGFAGSIAHARRRTSPRQLWLLQDDMRVEPGCLRALRDRLDADPSIAIAAPVTVDDEGYVRQHSRGGVVAADLSMDHWFPLERVRPSEFDTGHRLDWVASSGALIRVDALDAVGGIDPGFFPVFWGDVDLGYRLTRAGHRVVVVPEAVARHEHNGSSTAFLREAVAPVNAARFRAKATGGAQPVAIDVDRDIADAVLAAAANGFVDLTVFGQDRDDHWRDEIARLRSSRSMRITAPLRALGRAVRHVRERGRPSREL
ncbi:MAG: glycosyltransferase [Acidimicrobiia bacterium]